MQAAFAQFATKPIHLILATVKPRYNAPRYNADRL